MRIKFLGTSHGLPEANRKCSCTLIEVSGRYYFIDMGTMAAEYLANAGISMDDVKGIFITHMHGDHTCGLIQFVDLISWYYTTANPTICLPNPEAAKVIESWIKLHKGFLRDLDYREVKEGIIFDDGFLKVTAIPTLHRENSHAFLLEAEGKTVLFTGDLKHPDQDFPAIVKERETDMIVMESAHFHATCYAPHLKECKTKAVYVNHYQPKLIPFVLQLAEEMKDTVPVKLLYDGNEVIL